MTYNCAKPTTILASSIVMLMMFSGISYVFADDNNDFVSVNAERIKNDPVLAKILENIEKSRQEFSDIQQKTNQEKFIDDQRTLAKNIVQQELEQMFKDNEDFTSIAAFSNFLKTVSDENTKTIFQGLFDYKENKIDSARSVMGDVLRNGGSLQDARDAYHKALQIPRSDMIQLVNDLNIQTGFSDSKIQNHFDGDGKLPRYENEQDSIISFIDLTTSAKNVNRSPTETEDRVNQVDYAETKEAETKEAETKESENNSVEIKTTLESSKSTDNSEKILIQKLLDEIKTLKDKIADLEKKRNLDMQQVVLEQKASGSKYFANWLVSSSQGLTSNGTPISDERSISHMVLNEPNSYDKKQRFFSLGDKGEVTVQFSQPVTGELTIYEATFVETTSETASVEVSLDGKTWTQLDKMGYSNPNFGIHEFTYDISALGCVEFVKITDSSSTATRPFIGNGFDVDAIGATQACTDNT